MDVAPNQWPRMYPVGSQVMMHLDRVRFGTILGYIPTPHAEVIVVRIQGYGTVDFTELEAIAARMCIFRNQEGTVMPRKPVEPRPYGKKGWTDTEPVKSLWLKYIPQWNYFRKTNWADNLIYFRDMPLSVAKELFALMPEKCQEQNVQNGELTMKDLLNLASPGSLVHGYVVRSIRGDERISFEGLHVPADEATDVMAELISNNWIPDECHKAYHRSIWQDGKLMEAEDALQERDLSSEYWAEYVVGSASWERQPLFTCPMMYRLWWD